MRGVWPSLGKLPLPLYWLGAGWLLRERFLVLGHRGRISGRRHETVLEVVHHDAVADVYVVVSGWGERAQWLRNIQTTPEVDIVVGTRRLEACAVRVDHAQSVRLLMHYGRRHPVLFAVGTRLLAGRRLPPTFVACQALALRIPVVALRVRRNAQEAPRVRPWWRRRAWNRRTCLDGVPRAIA
jgi:deazaflavin-dependent oxidoreductase (nitroreductase family)